MVAAGRELFGPGFTADGISFGGRLDPLIMVDMLVKSGCEPSAANMKAFRDTYTRLLPEHLASGTGRSLPGVNRLVPELGATDGVVLGLLTGNFAETGLMKLRACGVETERFTINVWGDDSPHDPPARDHLPGVGLTRYRQRFGRGIDPREVVIIGDTPHDVSCAKVHGCRSLGVATGSYKAEELRACGADCVVMDLSDTTGVRDWLLS
jgi:phosphoglycolate phosphatase-like HAD superfamily hydrolase